MEILNTAKGNREKQMSVTVRGAEWKHILLKQAEMGN
jgi:hypothetical protein